MLCSFAVVWYFGAQTPMGKIMWVLSTQRYLPQFCHFLRFGFMHLSEALFQPKMHQMSSGGRTAADLGMFSMLDQTGAPQKGGPQKEQRIFCMP